MEKIKNIKSPFMCYCAKVIPLAFDESMSYYECLCNFYNYLKNEVMPVINNNADATKELQDLFVELENYVNTYFDNLDIQEEINNKLDEMYEDGKLSSLLTEYLQLKTTYTFDTVEEMKLATNFINGCFAKTLGYNEYNDGGESYYKIRTKTNDDTTDEIFLIALYDDTLVAELQIKNNEINVKQAGLTGVETEDATDILTLLCATNYDLYFPEGIYSINAPITLTNNIRGEGKDKSIIKYNGESHNEMINSYHVVDLKIKDLCFDCGTVTDIVKTSINLYYTEGLTILNCEFKNGYGSFLRLNESDKILIENCYFHDISGDESNMGNAIYCHPVTNMLVKNCECKNLMEDFVYLDGDDTHIVKNVIIENCYLHDTSHNNQILVSNCIGINGYCENIIVNNCILINNGAGIRCQGRYGFKPKDVFITNNKISDNIQNGLNITADNCVITNNIIYNCPQDAVYILSSNNVTFSDNIVYSSGRNGVWARGSNYLSIENCRIYNNYTCGLSLGTTSDYSCSHVNISNCEIYQSDDGTQLTGIQYLYGNDAKIISCHAYNNTLDYDINRAGVTNFVSQLNPIRTKSTIKSLMYSDEIIATGTYNIGDIILYTNPVANGKIGAVCVTAGTPGTWKEFGKIDN